MFTGNMIFNRLFCALILVCELFALNVHANSKDKRGSEDHPLVARFPDTHIQSQKTIDFGRLNMALGPLTQELRAANKKSALPPVKVVEGRIVSTQYRTNLSEISAARIFKSYENSLLTAGFEPLFSCESDKECGQRFVVQLYYYGDHTRRGQHEFNAPNIHKNHQYFYWSGLGKSKGQEYAVNLVVAQRTSGGIADIIIDIVKIEKMKVENIKVDFSAALADDAKEKTATVGGSNTNTFKDKHNAKDHPLLDRFPGTHIQSQKAVDHGRLISATGPLTRELKAAGGKSALPPYETSEGNIVSTHYRANLKETSALRIFRSYEGSLIRAGFKQLFSCESDKECGQKFVTQLYYYGDDTRRGQHRNFSAPNIHNRHQYFYWSGLGQSEGQNYAVNLLVSKSFGGIFAADVVVDIAKIEAINLEEIKVDLSADLIEKSIHETGRAVLDGIYFDFDKATLTAESERSIKIIAEFLKGKTKQKYYVVGHTDIVGDLAYNRKISQSRANAVVQQLVKNEGISAGRLEPVGIGPVSPIASNANEIGRGFNRRVELVPQQ